MARPKRSKNQVPYCIKFDPEDMVELERQATAKGHTTIAAHIRATLLPDKYR